MHRSMFAVSFTVPFAVLLAILSAGCDVPRAPDSVLTKLHGQTVTVFIRHDVLGQASDIPSSISVGVLNGAEVSLTGKLILSSPHWIVIEVLDSRWTIPRENVLAIRQITPSK
jgi:hypothetical protein